MAHQKIPRRWPTNTAEMAHQLAHWRWPTNWTAEMAHQIGPLKMAHQLARWRWPASFRPPRHLQRMARWREFTSEIFMGSNHEQNNMSSSSDNHNKTGSWATRWPPWLYTKPVWPVILAHQLDHRSAVVHKEWPTRRCTDCTQGQSAVTGTRVCLFVEAQCVHHRR